MKGRVACIMGMNELLITEMVFRNTLANLQACEVAALLSALVFQAKSSVEPELSDTLKKVNIILCTLHSILTYYKFQSIEEIEEINNEILSLELKHHITAVEGIQSNLNFKLVQVVYEWARQKVRK